MVFPILGSGDSSAGYNIENSCRFGGDNHRLEFTTSSSGNRKTFTLSFWLKKWKNAGANQSFFYTQDDSNNYLRFYFDSSESMQLRVYISNSLDTRLHTNRLFRDPSAWYHIVVAVDTTQGTSSNRVKLYINGIQETSLSTATYPSQNTDYPVNNSSTLYEVGDEHYSHAEELRGYLADYYFIDGLALTPTSFGETDEDSGIWKPKRAGVTFGTNGFKLEFKQTGTSQNSSGIGADTSGEDNHFAVTNLAATDQTTDTPTNNFCTFNPLNPKATFTLAEGNCKNLTLTDNHWIWSTMFVNKGKWYFEIKQTNIGGCGIKSLALENSQGSNTNGTAGSVEFSSFHGTIYYDTSSDTTVAQSSNGDIIGCAFDMDNSKIYWHVNGTYIATTGGTQAPAAGTNPITFSNSGGEYYAPTFSAFGDDPVAEVNFGNPSFSISSGNADADGYGNFEYAVPSGFYALCTKNLAEYG